MEIGENYKKKKTGTDQKSRPFKNCPTEKSGAPFLIFHKIKIELSLIMFIDDTD